MSDAAHLPEIGDRIRIEGASEIFVVIEVNPQTDSVSLIPETDLQTPLDNLISIESARS